MKDAIAVTRDLSIIFVIWGAIAGTALVVIADPYRAPIDGHE